MPNLVVEDGLGSLPRRLRRRRFAVAGLVAAEAILVLAGVVPWRSP